MRGFICTAAVLVALVASSSGFAQSHIPNLKGVWVMKSNAVVHEKKDEMQPERHVDVRKGFTEVEFVFTIDKQEGFRFSGKKSSDKRKEDISGVIGFDNKSIYMVDDDGMMLCRLVAPDKMEQIYLHVTPHRSVAARGMMERKR